MGSDEEYRPGKITISRPRGGDDGQAWIELTDESSGVHFVQLRIPLADFAAALFGQGCVPMEFQLVGADRVGMVRQNKTVILRLPPHVDWHSRLTADEIDKMLAPVEIDGWVAYRRDFENGHRWRDGVGRITMFRHVEPGPGVEPGPQPDEDHASVS